MSIACCEIGYLKTPLGEVHIEGPVCATDLENLFMNDKLSNFRPPARQKAALIDISKLPEGMIYIARNGREIIGYVTFHYPDNYSRWSKHPRVLELGCIEISSDWRKYGIGLALLKEAFLNPVLEEYIVIAIEFFWDWDIKGSGLGIFEYQWMLTKLFGTVGLKRRVTDDPDITEHPANVLMVRAGQKISKKDIVFFENMLFKSKTGILPVY